MNNQEIGRRIREQRKYIKRVSQEKMADDLFMYQADISNMEKGKKGSGIADLDKLNLIADYLGISLDFLIFGTKETIMPYFKKKTTIEEGTLSKEMKMELARLTGKNEKDIKARVYQVGDYSVYILKATIRNAEFPMELFENRDVNLADISVNRYQMYTFYKKDVIASMVIDQTTLLVNSSICTVEALAQTIPQKCLDALDVFRHLNPFVPLSQFDEKRKEEYQQLALERFQKLMAIGEDNPILYLESCYVKNEYRQNGVFTLNLDILKSMFPNAIFWLNMEPTSEEINASTYMSVIHSTKDITQITLNNLIAEKLGFVVDPDLWGIQVKDDENEEIKKIRVRKCAYIIPEIYNEILKDDEGLVEKGRMLQELKQNSEEIKEMKTNAVTITNEGSTPDWSNIHLFHEEDAPDFDSMRIIDSKYRIYQVHPLATGGVFSELTLEDEKTKETYFITLASFDCDHSFFVTDKPVIDTYISTMQDGIPEDYFIRFLEEMPVESYVSDFDEIDLEGSKFKKAFELLYALDQMDASSADKENERIRGKILKEI